MKYSLRLREIPKAKPKGFPEGSNIFSHHQCFVSNVNPLPLNFMKYCLNIIHKVFITGSRRLKLLNESAITATT